MVFPRPHRMIVLLLLLCGADAPPAAQQISDEQFAKSLTVAREGGFGRPNFAAALQSVADRFPEAKVSEGFGKGVWNKAALNTFGRGIDCVRFRTPKQPMDMRWAFLYTPRRIESWYIMPREGQMGQGFTEFHPYPAHHVGGIGRPGDAEGIFQDLPAALLKPDTEYLLWFTFPDRHPLYLRYLITFVPPEQGKPDAVRLLSAMGLGWQNATEDPFRPEPPSAAEMLNHR